MNMYDIMSAENRSSDRRSNTPMQKDRDYHIAKEQRCSCCFFVVYFECTLEVLFLFYRKVRKKNQIICSREENGYDSNNY